MMKQLFVIMILLLCITGCNNKTDNITKEPSVDEAVTEKDDNANVENETMVNDGTSIASESNYSVREIFPITEGFVWYYEGPNDSEKVSIIDEINELDNGLKLSVISCREDLSGEQKLESRLSNTIIKITDSSILIDDSIVLSEPLIVGTKWETKYMIKPSGVEYLATIEITEVDDGKITTNVVASQENNSEDESYEEVVVYEVGLGIISDWYNIIGMDGYKRGFDLKKTYNKPVIPEKWYLTPYQIEREKDI